MKNLDDKTPEKKRELFTKIPQPDFFKQNKGVIIPKSSCCGVNVKYRPGGVKIPYCPQCGNECKEVKYR